jgi:hypothetical protein
MRKCLKNEDRAQDKLVYSEENTRHVYLFYNRVQDFASPNPLPGFVIMSWLAFFPDRSRQKYTIITCKNS